MKSCDWIEVGPWERVEARQGYANGYKPKQVQSRIGSLSLWDSMPLQ